MLKADDSPTNIGRTQYKSPTKKSSRQLKSNKTLFSITPHHKSSHFLPTQKRRISSLHKIEEYADNISLITDAFLNNHHNQKKVKVFNHTFSDWLEENSYLNLLLIIRQFHDFNVFDYLNVSMSYSDNMSSKEISQRIEMLSIRNNIVLSILVIAKEVELRERIGEINFNQTEPLFADLRFLDPLIERFKTIILENDTHFPICIDVELFFFAILGYKDKARVIKQKFNQYFKDFLIDCNLAKFNFDHFLNITIEKQHFNDFRDEELIIFRKIFNNAALRNFYYGMKFIMRDIGYCFIFSEGRLWKSLGMKLKPSDVYELWLIYDENLDEMRPEDIRETLSIEYEEKIKGLNKKISAIPKNKQISDEYDNLVYERKGLDNEIKLYNVTSLQELIIIFFQSDLKELVLFFFEQYLDFSDDQKIPIEIFEICLNYDEDICIDIVDNSLSISTVKSYHIEIALIKKYFRLARQLLKFPQCLHLLNAPPPKTDDYISYLSRLNVDQKKRLFEKIKYQKGNSDLKIVDMMQDNDTLVETENIMSLHGTESKVDHPSLISRITQDILEIKLHKNPTYDNNTNNKLGRCVSVQEKNEEDNSKINFLQLRDNATLFPKKKNNNQGNTIEEQSQDDQENRTLTKVITGKPTIQISQYDESNQNDNIYNTKINVISMKASNILSYRTKDKDNHLGLTCDYQPSSLLNPFKQLSSKRISFQRNDGEANTPTSKFSVCSNSRLLADDATSNYNNVNTNIQNSFQMKRTKTEDIRFERIKAGQMKINVQMILIEHLRLGQYAFDALCLLSSIQIKSIHPDYTEKICSFLLVFTTNEDAITKCTEPLLLIALAAELLFKIAKINAKIKFKAESVGSEILRLGENIQSSMKDEDMLNYYLKEQCDHIGRSALEIYAENKFFTLLGDLNVGSIVGKLWFGSGHEQSIYKFLRMTRILMSNVAKEHYEPMVQSSYLPADSVYSFQFYQFINNCSVRFFFESFSVVMITILYQFIIYSYVTFTKEEDVFHPSTHYYHMINLIANGLMYCCILNYLVLLLYYYKTGRRLRLQTIELVINIIMFFALLLNYMNLPEKLYPVHDYQDMNILLDGIIYSVILTMGWMKVIVILMSTNTYGPFLRIMFDIFWHVFAFLVIVFCITFLFAQCFTLYFRLSNDDFVFFYNGFIALFNTAFGQCAFEKFVDLQIFGFVALIAYTTLSNIMLFNLIVAIINNLFNNLEDKADAENRAVLVLTHERLKWDERYGLLILLPTPLNALSLIFIPFLFIAGDSVKQWNMVFSKICYFFVAILIFLFILCLSVICYPFTLIKSLIHSSYDSTSLSRCQNALNIILSIFTRPFILLGYMGSDLFLYWALVYKEPQFDQTQDDTKLHIRQYILALRKVLNEARYKEKKKTLPINELYTKLCLFKKKPKERLSNTINKIERLSSESSYNSKRSKEHRHQDLSPISNLKQSSENIHETSISSSQLGKNRLQEEMKAYFRQLIDKVVDPEGFIDIERTLLILPDRVKYSDSFVKNMKNINIRVFIRGLTKYFFYNAIDNPIYSFKKLQLLVYKIIVKFKMMYAFIPEKTLQDITKKFQWLNENPQFLKTPEALQKYEERDDVSEYDDEGEYALETIPNDTRLRTTIKSIKNDQLSTNTNRVTNYNITGEGVNASDDNYMF